MSVTHLQFSSKSCDSNHILLPSPVVIACNFFVDMFDGAAGECIRKGCQTTENLCAIMYCTYRTPKPNCSLLFTDAFYKCLGFYKWWYVKDILRYYNSNNIGNTFTSIDDGGWLNRVENKIQL